MIFSLRHNIINDSRGIAAVEFALIAPLLIVLFFGVLEVSNLLIADTKLRAANAAAADILTQDSDDVSLTDLQDINIATQRIMFPLPAVSGTDIATLVDTYGTPTSPPASWSRILPNSRTTVLGLSVRSNCKDLSRLPPTLTLPVLRTETAYVWRPQFASIFAVAIRLKSVNYFTPRYSSTLNLASALAPYC
jgi:Flp pilus assembly protein TadG